MTMGIKELKQMARKLSDAIDALDTADPLPVHDPNAFRVGDWVKIVRKVEKAEGWDNPWDPDMDSTLGGLLKVRETNMFGILLGGWYYPSCALELAAPPFPTAIWVRDDENDRWRGPEISAGYTDLRGQILTSGGTPWKYWTTEEPEECRLARLGGEP